MDDQLEKLLILQDLDLMIIELTHENMLNTEKELGFDVPNIEKLKSTRESLMTQIDQSLVSHYNKLIGKYKRTVVPVQDNTCLGCFIRLPSSITVKKIEGILICEHCSRFLFDLNLDDERG
jgi:predicted  nucleic acid-binding Zn-ribbon protein